MAKDDDDAACGCCCLFVVAGPCIVAFIWGVRWALNYQF